MHNLKVIFAAVWLLTGFGCVTAKPIPPPESPPPNLAQTEAAKSQIAAVCSSTFDYWGGRPCKRAIAAAAYDDEYRETADSGAGLVARGNDFVEGLIIPGIDAYLSAWRADIEYDMPSAEGVIIVYQAECGELIESALDGFKSEIAGVRDPAARTALINWYKSIEALATHVLEVEGSLSTYGEAYATLKREYRAAATDVAFLASAVENDTAEPSEPTREMSSDADEANTGETVDGPAKPQTPTSAP